MSAGKGDRRRPRFVSRETWEKNYELAFGEHLQKAYLEIIAEALAVLRAPRIDTAIGSPKPPEKTAK